MEKQMNYVEKMQVALDALQEVFDDVKDLKNQSKINEEKTQDILHMIENVNFNACQGFSFSKRLQELRQERREIKNKVEQSHQMQKILNAFKDNVKRHLEHSIKQADKLQDEQDQRVYNLRRLKEYDEWNNKIIEQKMA